MKKIIALFIIIIGITSCKDAMSLYNGEYLVTTGKYKYIKANPSNQGLNVQYNQAEPVQVTVTPNVEVKSK